MRKSMILLYLMVSAVLMIVVGCQTAQPAEPIAVILILASLVVFMLLQILLNSRKRITSANN